MPIVLSAPPPRKKSLNSSSDSSIEGLDEPDLGGSGRDVRVRFEVSVGGEGVGEGEEVRITGNTSSLGKWDVYMCVCVCVCVCARPHISVTINKAYSFRRLGLHVCLYVCLYVCVCVWMLAGW